MTNQQGEPAIMTDSKPIVTNDEPLECGVCHAPLGTKRLVGDDTIFIIGGFPAYAIHGFCPCCGAAVHLTSNAERLKRLMARVVGSK